MKEYDVSKEINKELSIPLLSFLGKAFTEEFSKLPKSDVEPNRIYFDFDDGYESFTEKTIEKFIEEFTLKPQSKISLRFLSENNNFTVWVDYGTTMNDVMKIKVPIARFSLKSHSTNQVWCEGIINKFLKLIKEFDISQIHEKPLEVKTSEKPLEVKTSEKPLEVKTSEKSRDLSTFVKNHLPQTIIGIVTSVIGGLIVLWYFTSYSVS